MHPHESVPSPDHLTNDDSTAHERRATRQPALLTVPDDALGDNTMSAR